MHASSGHAAEGRFKKTGKEKNGAYSSGGSLAELRGVVGTFPLIVEASELNPPVHTTKMLATRTAGGAALRAVFAGDKVASTGY